MILRLATMRVPYYSRRIVPAVTRPTLQHQQPGTVKLSLVTLPSLVFF